MIALKYSLAIYFIIFISFSEFAHGQSTQKIHAFSGTLVLTADGGFTFAKTDYKQTKIGSRLLGGVEYYLPAYSSHIFGIRGYFGGQTIKSEDENRTISLPDLGATSLPDVINAEMYLAGLELIYSFSIKDKFFPFVSGGLSNIWFSPKIENGQRAPNNAIGGYKRSAISYDIEAGIRYQISDNISLNLQGGIHFPNTDNLDDVTTGAHKDFYATSVVGISYSLFGKRDSDDDGIFDNIDKCTDQSEDFDGFEDEDGCPELDNDKDGISDILDKCPDTPEDLDSFQDNDGCPDIDNDRDGINDELDECPNETEDIDNFEDENGCPDSDNDGDLIPDIEDDCPNYPGTRSNNGCSGDTTGVNQTVLAPKEILIEAESTFLPDKAEIRPEATSELSRIIKILQLYPDVNWRIEGHTDEHQVENLMVRTLSLRRAEAILNYFVSKGLPSFQFRVYDMGDKFPIANNNTQFGRMKNRRIVLVREN